MRISPLSLAIAILFSTPILAAEQPLEKLLVVTEELNCVNEHLQSSDGVTWDDVCYTPQSYQKTQRNEMVTEALDGIEAERHRRNSRIRHPAVTASQPREINPPEHTAKQSPSKTRVTSREPQARPVYEDKGEEEKLVTFELGTTSYYHHYKEPGIMEQDGFFNGFNAVYTQRLSLNEDKKKFTDHFGNDDRLTMFRIEGLAAYGRVDFGDSVVGDHKNRKDYVLEARGLAGYDFPVGKNSRVTPFFGIAYRYLNDDSPGRVVQASSSFFPFERESRMLYMPFGFLSHHRIKNHWTVDITMEYDLLLQGWQRNHYEDGGLQIVDGDTGIPYALDSLDFQQDRGYGLRAAIKFIREGEKFTLFIEPFFNFWRIADSDPRQFTSESGHYRWFYDAAYTLPIMGLQDKSYTQEAGIRAGFHF